MKARLYFAAVLFSCARVCADLGLTQFPLYEGIEPHTDPTDLTEFARLVVNLTDALRSLASSGSHTDPTEPTDFARLALNLTELGRKVVGHIRVLRVLRFPKFTQIQRDSTKIICANLWQKKYTYLIH